MGTFAIIQALLRHWEARQHPVYVAEARAMAIPIPLVKTTRSVFSRFWRSARYVGGVLLALVIVQFYCARSSSLGLSLLTGFTWIAIGGVLIGAFFLTYLWPVAIAMSIAGTIAREREQQTWDVLLTTPLGWGDVLLAKMAAALVRLHPYGDMLLWVQAFLVMVLFVMVSGPIGREQNWNLTHTVLILGTAFEFVIERIQDYALSLLLGLLASLLSSRRQSAGVMAMMFAGALILLRTGITITLLVAASSSNGFSWFESLFLIMTGPASVIPIALTFPLALSLLIVLPLVREWLIRALFQWLVAHLGDAPQVL